MADIGFWNDLVQGLSGKGQFRLILQPTMAIILGVRLGLADSRAGATPFLLRLITMQGRARLFRESLREVVFPLIAAFLVDAVLQVITLGRFRPLQAMVVGALLVWIPFSISRALTNRFSKAREPHVPRPA